MGVNGIYGLSGSGLDIESMVKVGMMSKQNEYDKMQQKYTQNEWKKSAYLDVYSKVQTFNNSTLSQYKMSNTMNARAANSSNSTAVTATANATAANMTHYVEVGQLANAAYLIGKGAVERIGKNAKSDSIALSDSILKSIKYADSVKVDNKTVDRVTYTDANGDINTVNADDVAFSFKLSDGKTGSTAVSDHENVFTAKIVSDNATTKNHTVTVDEIATQAHVTSKRINALSGTDKVSKLFSQALGINNEKAYINAISELKDDNGGLNIEVGYAESDTKTIKISFAELANTDTTVDGFIGGLNIKLKDAGLKNISASFKDGALSFTNGTYGDESKIFVSMGQLNLDISTPPEPATLKSAPEFLSEPNSDLALSSSISELLEGAWGDKTKETLAGYRNNNSGTAFSLTFSAGVDSNIKTTKVSFSYSELTNSGTKVSDFIDKLNAAFTKDKLDLTASLNDNGQLVISASEIGSDSKISIDVDPTTAKDNKDDAQSLVKFLSGGGDIRTTNGGVIENDDMVQSFGAFLNGETINSGTNGSVEIDGISKKLDSKTGNTIKLSGIEYNFTGSGTGDVNFLTKPAEISVTYKQLMDGYTFNDLVSDINNAGTNIRATYDTVQDRFSIYNKESGEESKISIITGDDRATAFFNSMKLVETANGELVDDSQVNLETGIMNTIAGQDAIANIDGLGYKVSSNTATVNGVIYSFKAVTSELVKNEDDGTFEKNDGGGYVFNSESSNKVSMNITQDADKIVDKVKSFVEDYNKLLSSLQELYNEKPNSGYTPLSDTQKAEMKEEQITKWEEKAKAGMLYHDRTLGTLIDKMRDAVSGRIEGLDGKYNTIYSIGISTTGTKGQLTLDEDKLRAAIADEPDAVYNVFAKLDDNDDANGNGIAQRLGDVLTTNMKAIRTRAGADNSISEDSDLNNLMRELQTKMSNFKIMMNAFEEKLYKKYDAMESSLALLGAQLNYVTGAYNS